MCLAFLTDMIRPLNVIINRIAVREIRIQHMINRGIDAKAVDVEREVLDSLKTEYKNRVNRLNKYMGIN